MILKENESYLDATSRQWDIITTDGGAAFAGSGGTIPHAIFTLDGESLSVGVPNLVAIGKSEVICNG